MKLGWFCFILIGKVVFCQECSPGQYRDDNNSCKACEIGHSSSDGMNCIPCLPNHYTGGIGSGKHEDFNFENVGKITNEDGVTICNPCPKGTETVNNDRLKCHYCRPFTFKDTDGAQSQESCIPCEFGKYLTGYTELFPNKFSGARRCEACPSNFFCPDPLTKLPIPKGFSSPNRRDLVLCTAENGCNECQVENMHEHVLRIELDPLSLGQIGWENLILCEIKVLKNIQEKIQLYDLQASPSINDLVNPYLAVDGLFGNEWYDWLGCYHSRPSSTPSFFEAKFQLNRDEEINQIQLYSHDFKYSSMKNMRVFIDGNSFDGSIQIISDCSNMICPFDSCTFEDDCQSSELSKSLGFCQNGNGFKEQCVHVNYFIGCFKDTSNRAMTHRYRPPKTGFTTRECRNGCGSLGYKYSALQHESECWCDNSFEDIAQYGPADDCSLCDPFVIGGPHIRVGPWTNCVFLTDFVGCFGGFGRSAMSFQYKEGTKDFGFTTLECRTACGSLGYKFAGLQHYNQCFCESDFQKVIHQGIADCPKCEPGYKGGHFIDVGQWKNCVFQSIFIE